RIQYENVVAVPLNLNITLNQACKVGLPWKFIHTEILVCETRLNGFQLPEVRQLVPFPFVVGIAVAARLRIRRPGACSERCSKFELTNSRLVIPVLAAEGLGGK